MSLEQHGYIVISTVCISSISFTLTHWMRKNILETTPVRWEPKQNTACKEVLPAFWDRNELAGKCSPILRALKQVFVTEGTANQSICFTLIYFLLYERLTLFKRLFQRLAPLDTCLYQFIINYQLLIIIIDY